jgi:DNA-binding IclR family transcriptional regulator
MSGLTIVELAERVKETQGRIAGFLSDWLEAGWVERDGDRWRLTPAGLEAAYPVLDLRDLGEEDVGEVKRSKRSVNKVVR